MMRIITFLLVAATVSAGCCTTKSFETCCTEPCDCYTFEKYVADFKLSFQPSEIPARKAAFATELARVTAHNSKNLGWKEQMNRFSVMTAGEKKAYMGRHKGVGKAMLKNNNPLPADFQMKPVSALPREVDWRKKGKYFCIASFLLFSFFLTHFFFLNHHLPLPAGVVTAVKDQGHCGSCWAFASTATMESHVAIATGLLFDLSPQQVAMCSPNPESCGGTGGCEGATAEVAFDYVANSAGLFQEFQYPYASYYGVDYTCATPAPADTNPVATITGFVKLPENNYTALMNAIATVGPIAVSVDASTFHSYAGGIFSGCNQENPDINHAVTLVGYGEENGQKYWLIRNSWNPKYGEQGYIRVARMDTEEEICGMDITPTDGSACNGDTTPVKVCGTCGVLFDSSYPTGAKVL
jgi:cathepsin L